MSIYTICIYVHLYVIYIYKFYISVFKFYYERFTIIRAFKNTKIKSKNKNKVLYRSI